MAGDRFLITGGTGFVGANVVRALIDRQEDVTVLTRSSAPAWRLEGLEGRYKTIIGDVSDDAVSDKIRRAAPTVVFHFAAYGSMPAESDPIRMVRTNMEGLVRLTDTLRDCPIRLFVNTGSSSEYGIKQVPMSEDQPLEPINDYAVTKAAASLYCRKIGVRDGFPAITLRLFSPYGPYEQPSRLIPTVLSGIMAGKGISLAAPTHVRDFIYIHDVVEAYLATVSIRVMPGETYNIGSGVQHSVADVVAAAEQVCGKQATITWDCSLAQKRQVEPSLWQADITKFHTATGWTPASTLIMGLRDTHDMMLPVSG